MYKFIRQRLITAIFVLWGATFLTYAMMAFAPGNPAQEIAFARYGAIAPSTIEWIRQKEGLDKPFYLRYLYWTKHILSLDFGLSLVEKSSVWALIKTHFFRTIELSIAAILLSLLIAIPLGFFTATRQGTILDSLGTGISSLGLSMPNYWLGLLLIVFFSVKMKWLPAFGRGDWRHIILPSITLGTSLIAYTSRILRSAIIEALQAEYITSLRAKGLKERLIIGRHAFKNALIPVVTILGLELAMVFEGAVLTETIFAWPGLGNLLVQAVSNRDYPLIQGIVLVISTMFVSISFFTDIIYYYLDPRIRF
ncbi:MAG: ABC transporter permease [bacterium]